MQLRRSTALLAGVLLTAAATTAGCGTSTGLDAATNRVYTPAAGYNNRDFSVDVLGALVVSAQDGSGTFVATFVNNSSTDPATVDAMAAGSADPNVKVGEFSALTVPARGRVNLADGTTAGIPITGDVTAGDVLDLTVTLGSGDTVPLQVPVVPDDGDFDGLDSSGTLESSDGA